MVNGKLLQKLGIWILKLKRKYKNVKKCKKKNKNKKITNWTWQMAISQDLAENLWRMAKLEHRSYTMGKESLKQIMALM